MNTILEGNIYVPLSHWNHYGEESKGEEDVYVSSDDDLPLPKPFSKPGGVTLEVKPQPGSKTGAFLPQKFEAIPKPASRAKMNPNAIYLKYEKLLKVPAIESKGSPIHCKQCSSSLDSLNCKIVKGKWICELCKSDNELKGPIPKFTGSCFRYELENQEKISMVEGEADYVMIIDTSGSMSVVAELNKADPSKSKSALKVLVERINTILIDLAKDSPDTRVGIITINANVTLLGDCTMDPVELSDDAVLCSDRRLKLNVKHAEKEFFKTPISKSIGRIQEKLKGLEENGATALGPALVCGLELLKDKKNGKLLVFTDGISNVGIGDLTADSPEDQVANANYYTYWGSVAREQGTEVNFYTIFSEESPFDVSLYYPMVRDVDGSIFAVYPDQSMDDLGLPMEQELLGRYAKVTIILPRELKFTAAVLKFQVESDKFAALTSRRFTKKYGKLVATSRELLHFVVNTDAVDKAVAAKLKSLLIHLKLEWTDKDNKRHLLELTQSFPVMFKKGKKANLEALKEAMLKCREETVRANQQERGVAEITSLLDNFLKNPESELAIQLKKEAEETRENIKKSVKNKAVTTAFFTSATSTTTTAVRPGTTKFN